MNQNLGAVWFIGIVVCFLFVFIVMAGLFVLFMVFAARANLKRHRETTEACLHEWAAREGYELLAVDEAAQGEDHPFQEKFGWVGQRTSRYGGAVRRVRVRDNYGQPRSGWVFLPYKPKTGLLVGRAPIHLEFDRANLEVIWMTRPEQS